MEDTYIPVSNRFYEELEELAMMRKTCVVTFMQDGSKAVVKGRATALVEKEEAAYLVLESGLYIRLDRIREVNGRHIESFA